MVDIHRLGRPSVSKAEVRSVASLMDSDQPPDLSPRDLIPKMKEQLHGIRFKTVPEILAAVDRSILTINRTGAATGVLRLSHCWKWVIHNAGDYIEAL